MRKGTSYTVGYSYGEFDLLRTLRDLNDVFEVIESFNKKKINKWLHHNRTKIELQGTGPLVTKFEGKLVINANLWLCCGWERQYNIIAEWVTSEVYGK